MTDTFRAMCAELLQELCCFYKPWDLQEERYSDAMKRARALLVTEPRIISRDRDETGPYVVVAQPEPEGPTIGDVMQLWASTPHIDEAEGAIAFARAVLARWGSPAAAPVPVSERLPGPEDCDAEGLCWWWDPECEQTEGWIRGLPEYCNNNRSHWLPANALPLPAPEPEESQP